MLRSLHMKLVMILVLLILSLMMVVGAFLVNSVTAFYLEDFYTQMSNVFQDPELAADLTTQRAGETQPEGATMLEQILNAYAGELGVDGRNRKLYILGSDGTCLAGPKEEQPLNYTRNLTFALTTGLKTGESGDESNLAADYMDVAVPIHRGEEGYIIYILDNRATANQLTDQMFILIAEALLFGLVISILLSFLLSKTMVTPIQQLTEGTQRLAKGDFSKLAVTSEDEIGVLTGNFNDMAKRLQNTLRQVENERNKLDTLFLHMTDGVVAFSRQGEVIHANPAASRMLHTNIKSESNYTRLFGEIASLEQVLETPDPLESERRIGEDYLELILAPFDRGQEGGGVLALIHDVTEQRKNEEMRREFVANVSHELRTPLTNIRSYAETLVDNQGNIPPAMEQKFLGVILNESDRMTHIVQDLLTLSRLDSGRDELKLARFSFLNTIRDLYNAVYMEAQRHDHTLELDIEAGLPAIIADRERILQVMMNVVSNSIKYTPDGGRIVISAGRRESMVWMVVDDNGIGIPDEDRPRIFERFYRVDKARSRQSGGTGLGLSIAREIVERHEGTLELQDKDTPGLAVRLELKIEGPKV